MTRAADALTVLNSLPADVRRVVGHDFDNAGLNRDGGETVYSPLVRVLTEIVDGGPIDPQEYDAACRQVEAIRARARGAESAIRAFGVGAGQSYPDLLRAIQSARRLGEAGGLLDRMIVGPADSTAEDVIYGRSWLSENEE